ncbi:MAG: HlyD family efflux transporter periplasmic adaptor subunit [Cyanobacteria bacterium P01_A01_bin.40]
MELLRYKKSKDPPAEKKQQRQPNPWVVGSIMLCIGVGISYWYAARIETPTVEPEPTTKYIPTAVTALGRLEPAGEVIKLSVANAQDSRVNELYVKEGERVKANQLIATLQGLDKKQAELISGKLNVVVLQKRLAKVMAGEAKEAEITAQKANIARIQSQLSNESLDREAAIADAYAEYSNAKINYDRYQSLYQEGAVSQSQKDDRVEAYQRSQAKLNQAKARYHNTIDTLQKQIEQERSVLNQLREVRPVDIAEAQAELDYAIAQVKQIESELEDYYVRVPIDGQILKINTLVGEQVDTSKGIVELGRTERMYAIAEVYETDVGMVEVGDQAEIISEHGGFAGKLQGTVDYVGLQIKKQDILESDPAADKDARVVEVKVRLAPEDSDLVAKLTNLQVRVKIDLGDE